MRWRRSCPSVAAKLLSVRLRGKLRCLFSQVSPVTSACHPPNSPTSSCHHRQLLPHFSSPQPGCCYILTSSSTATLKSVPFWSPPPPAAPPPVSPSLLSLVSASFGFSLSDSVLSLSAPSPSVCPSLCMLVLCAAVSQPPLNPPPSHSLSLCSLFCSMFVYLSIVSLCLANNSATNFSGKHCF